jgi:hypothetical protein
MKSILDPSFRYTTSLDTDLSKTFARIRRDRRMDSESAKKGSVVTPVTVSPIFRKRSACQ